MKIYFYENYKSIFPHKSGKELTNALILESTRKYIETEYNQAISSEDIQVTRDAKGKPFVSIKTEQLEESCQWEIHVSVSHSQDTFACLIAEENCGIDIQFPRSTDFSKIAQRYFAGEEADYVDEKGAEGFYVLWTRKEAYAKFTGNGLINVIDKTDVLNLTDVVFDDSQLENGMYCSICKAKES